MQAERNLFILASLENQGSQLWKVKKKYKSITWKISTWLVNQVKKQKSRRDKPVLAMGQERTVWMDHGMGSYDHILIQDVQKIPWWGFFLF